MRLLGAVQLESNDEWAIRNRHLRVEPRGDLVPTANRGGITAAARTPMPPRAA